MGGGGGGSGKSPHAHRHALLLSLAIADLLTAVVCLPVAGMSFILPQQFTLPMPFCATVGLLQGLAHLVSNLALALVALDRFLALKKPKIAGLIASRSSLITAGLWVGALLLSLPRAILPNPSLPNCWPATQLNSGNRSLSEDSWRDGTQETLSNSSLFNNLRSSAEVNFFESVNLTLTTLSVPYKSNISNGIWWPSKNQSSFEWSDGTFNFPQETSITSLWRGIYYTTIVILGHTLPCIAVVTFHLAVSKALCKASKDNIKLNRKPKQVRV